MKNNRANTLAIQLFLISFLFIVGILNHFYLTVQKTELEKSISRKLSEQHEVELKEQQKEYLTEIQDAQLLLNEFIKNEPQTAQRMDFGNLVGKAKIADQEYDTFRLPFPEGGRVLSLTKGEEDLFALTYGATLWVRNTAEEAWREVSEFSFLPKEIRDDLSLQLYYQEKTLFLSNDRNIWYSLNKGKDWRKLDFPAILRVQEGEKKLFFLSRNQIYLWDQALEKMRLDQELPYDQISYYLVWENYQLIVSKGNQLFVMKNGEQVFSRSYEYRIDTIQVFSNLVFIWINDRLLLMPLMENGKGLELVPLFILNQKYLPVDSIGVAIFQERLYIFLRGLGVLSRPSNLLRENIWQDRSILFRQNIDFTDYVLLDDKLYVSFDGAGVLEMEDERNVRYFNTGLNVAVLLDLIKAGPTLYMSIHGQGVLRFFRERLTKLNKGLFLTRSNIAERRDISKRNYNHIVHDLALIQSKLYLASLNGVYLLGDSLDRFRKLFDRVEVKSMVADERQILAAGEALYFSQDGGNGWDLIEGVKDIKKLLKTEDHVFALSEKLNKIYFSKETWKRWELLELPFEILEMTYDKETKDLWLYAANGYLIRYDQKALKILEVITENSLLSEPICMEFWGRVLLIGNSEGLHFYDYEKKYFSKIIPELSHVTSINVTDEGIFVGSSAKGTYFLTSATFGKS